MLLALSLFWRTGIVILALSIIANLTLLVLGIDVLPGEHVAEVLYIKAKPSISQAAIALVFIAANFGLGTNLHRLLWGGRLGLSDHAWRVVAIGVALLFVMTAVLNMIVVVSASTETWVAVKFYGGLPLILLGHLGVAVWVARASRA